MALQCSKGRTADLGLIAWEVLVAEQVPAMAGYFTPMLHVAEIERSIPFYEILGFRIIDTDRGNPLGWARLHCKGGAVMFLRAEHEVKGSRAPVLFYMYTPDLHAFRERLLAHGVEVPPITHPGYMPSGEINFADPDGYHIGVAHWGESEHAAWLRRIEGER
ncbi:MAG TPA: VOC family protein [Bryobacteraceae bacterium]|nr:VOC family protein [Bryobacteraceae bacterium]